jgi:hypothetical protein
MQQATCLDFIRGNSSDAYASRRSVPLHINGDSLELINEEDDSLVLRSELWGESFVVATVACTVRFTCQSLTSRMNKRVRRPTSCNPEVVLPVRNF